MIAYDVIVIGAGHAGYEAALAAARMGRRVGLLTLRRDTVGKMSCNPAIGGSAKGHLVREIDALGGEMAKAIDRTGIQFRMLNRSKGPAVWSPRAQADRILFQQDILRVIESQPNLDLREGMVEQILVRDQSVYGVRVQTGTVYHAPTVIIATGTFLNGLMHRGTESIPGGRAQEPPAAGISACLSRLGFEVKRLKTGTPARLHKSSIDYSKFEEQKGDDPPQPFSFSTRQIAQPQISCYIGYTNPQTHAVIKDNIHLSAMYSGRIRGVGPRYCPSVEDKVMRFSQKDRHQIFLEPEGLQNDEIYVNGLSTSLPSDVQDRFMRTIPGLEDCQITRFGYAVEYDFCPPTQIQHSLETKTISGLFFAGQINGTSGYEEAGAQGVMAGINAALKVDGRPPLVLSRSDAYIGVLIDDLVTKGTDEPYRMFTSRAEYRLILRQDNADIRLMPIGHKIGLIDRQQFESVSQKIDKISCGVEKLAKTRLGGRSLYDTLKSPEVRYRDLSGQDPTLSEDCVEQIEITVKYGGYIQRQRVQVDRFIALERKRIPDGFDFSRIKGLKTEALQKLEKIRPISIGQAGRISGVTPCDISLLLVHLR